MCGIFFVKKNDGISINMVKTEFLKGQNRGPDNSQFLELSNYYMGFHRLSINGLNTSSNQPFVKNGIYLICNGEIYNYKELYSFIGINPQTESDCEIIIDLYMLYPINYFIQLLDGVFAFIIYDSKKNIIISARDPFGVRPMYYSSTFTEFSSELKQINNLTTNEINQFPPGYYNVNGIFYRYHVLSQYYLSSGSQFDSTERIFYKKIIRETLINAVKKRLLSDRPIACLLSGGLDSSLITSIVVELTKKNNIDIETFSIGLKDSTDIINARIVAKYLGTKHHEIILTENEFFDAIPIVIKAIESYDTTTVRASVGNYLISKYISNNSDAKVIFNGDGSDELTGGYLYFHKAPNNLSFDMETKNLLQNIHFFDVLRSDRSISSCGLEARTPFLDKTFVNTYLSIPLHYRREVDKIEKKLLRDSFSEYLPTEILYRKKEAFSDGVSGVDNSWYKIIENKLKNVNIPLVVDYNQKNLHLPPRTKEQLYYRYLFELEYPNREKIIPYFWMPKWSNSKDPSARTL